MYNDFKFLDVVLMASPYQENISLQQGLICDMFIGHYITQK